MLAVASDRPRPLGPPRLDFGAGEAVLAVRESRSASNRCPCEVARKAVAPNGHLGNATLTGPLRKHFLLLCGLFAIGLTLLLQFYH